jgi:hypothetical protein
MTTSIAGKMRVKHQTIRDFILIAAIPPLVSMLAWFIFSMVISQPGIHSPEIVPMDLPSHFEDKSIPPVTVLDVSNRSDLRQAFTHWLKPSSGSANRSASLRHQQGYHALSITDQIRFARRPERGVQHSWHQLNEHQREPINAVRSDLFSDKLIKIRPLNAARLGSYFIRLPLQNTRSLHLQIPHGQSDLMTDEIGHLLCKEYPFATCSFNNIHRRQYDFAHAGDSPFNELMNHYLAIDPESLFVQIHGFSTRKRQRGADQEADMILSGGSPRKAGVIMSALNRLDLSSPPTIRVYGAHTMALGATTNSQNRSLALHRNGHFLHIEVAYKIRKKLLNSTKKRALLYHIISEIAYEYQNH